MIKTIKLFIYKTVLQMMLKDYNMLYLTGKQRSQICSLIRKCEVL